MTTWPMESLKRKYGCIKEDGFIEKYGIGMSLYFKFLKTVTVAFFVAWFSVVNPVLEEGFWRLFLFAHMSRPDGEGAAMGGAGLPAVVQASEAGALNNKLVKAADADTILRLTQDDRKLKQD